MNKVKIKEIFESIQGEGPYVGYKQLFVRFCNCNLKCNYCDTEFSSECDYEEYDACTLADKINGYKTVHSVSLTGGEPLLSSDFLKELLPRINKKIYLETNATLADRFVEVKSFIDIVSADIKLESSTGIKNSAKFHDKFFEACRGVETFAKIVFNGKITDEEIDSCCELGQKYGIELILQPEMVSEDRKVRRPESGLMLENLTSSLAGEVCFQLETDRLEELKVRKQGEGFQKMSVTSDFAAQILDKFLEKYENVRLIPQVHKFLDVR